MQTVELRPLHEFPSAASVIFHEDCHALWFAKKDMSLADRRFAIAGRGALPQTELYEGMATAIGQGWFAKLAFGKSDKRWYADKLIDAYSHAAYPLYADYLDAGKTIDSDFARKATLIYFDKFAGAARDMRQTSEFFVFGDKLDALPTLRLDIEKQLPRLRELSMYFPLDSAEGIKVFRQSLAGHVAVLVPHDKLGLLEKLGMTDEQIELLKKKNSGWNLVWCGEKQYIVCVADTPAEQNDLLFSVLKRNKWPLAAR